MFENKALSNNIIFVHDIGFKMSLFMKTGFGPISILGDWLSASEIQG